MGGAGKSTGFRWGKTVLARGPRPEEIVVRPEEFRTGASARVCPHGVMPRFRPGLSPKEVEKSPDWCPPGLSPMSESRDAQALPNSPRESGINLGVRSIARPQF